MNRNASPSLFGWDFQINSAILLMLDNIKEAKLVRVEGKCEDVEITLQNQKKIYAQAKSVIKPDDYGHVLDKLSDALTTLAAASKNKDGILFTYITNSPNPFNNQRTMSYFTGRTHLHFSELPDVAQKKIRSIIKSKNLSDFDVNKMDIHVIPFYGDDPRNRYKEIRECINDFLGDSKINTQIVAPTIMEIWQRELFQNASQIDTSLTITKEKMIWPLIVLIVDNKMANDLKKDFDDDEIEDIEQKYRSIINQKAMKYEFISQVLTDFRQSKKSRKEFLEDYWEDYKNVVDLIDTDEETKRVLIKIILYRIIMQRKYIKTIKSYANL